MTTALAPVVHMDELEVIQRTGKMLAASGYFDAKGDGPQAVAMMATKILAGREIGIGPFAAVNGIHIISGKPAIGANLMASAVKGSGRYDYRVREISDKACRIEFFQRSGDKWESIGTSEFTADDARKAQTKNMDKFARNMLFARAMSNGIRWYCPDVFSGNAVYVPEELGATVDGDGNVVDVDVRRVDAPQLPAPAEPIDNPFEDNLAPTWYVAARQMLANGTASLTDKMRDLHTNGSGPCTEKQYRFLAGTLDGIVGEGGHGPVLTVICQTDISSGNRPSFDLAKKLLDYLPTHIKQTDGKQVANPAHRPDVVEQMVKIAAVVASVTGQTQPELAA